jgi:hypothetical protein
MLTLTTSDRSPGGVSRRSFLRAGFLGVAGLSLVDWLRLKCQAADRPARETAVILVWLNGGPSHIDLYDLKPNAPVEYRGAYRPVATRVPGVSISELLPRQGKLMDRLTLVRSLAHTTNDHAAGAAWLMTGSFGPTFERPAPTVPSVGSYVARLRGPCQEGMPPYVTVGGGAHQPYWGPSYLGPAYSPFTVHGDPNSAAFRVENLRLSPGVNTQRLDDRRALLGAMDTMRRDLDTSGAAAGLDRFQRAAYDLITSPRAQQAFELTREPEPLRERYGRNSWGQSVLLARRLVEAGVTFVTVSLSDPKGGWDHHENIAPRIKEMGQVYDQALAALVEDLCDRGLYDRVCVCVCGEFGRGPLLTRDAGRDHWGKAGFALLGGAGLKTGQVVGSTTAKGEEPKDRPVGPGDLLATLYHVLGIDTRQNFEDRTGRPLPVLATGDPIIELV